MDKPTPTPLKELQNTENMRKMLPLKVLRDATPRQNRIFAFDPTDLYGRADQWIRPTKRIQSGLSMGMLWPDLPDGSCPCGCGAAVPKNRRYATNDCSGFCNDVFAILYGHSQHILRYIRLYHGNHCVCCGPSDIWTPLFLDHIVPVKHGGGGSWLSNYQLLCGPCHRIKTNTDFGWKGTQINQT